MNKFKSAGSRLGILLSSVLLGYTAAGQPSVSVGVSVPLPSVEVVLPSVEIHAESDFYEPLTPHGEWVVVGSYGRCWRPARVAVGWRPYCNGNWQRTDAGWYWVSEEPWAWATYHYGRWDFTDEYGWYWVPQIQWAPAWVSWHSGGGYMGWAPLQPFVSISVSGFVGFNQSRISPRAFVFVEQRRFLDPVRPTTVVVNNTTIINKTTTISNTKIVNNTVINEGPATTIIAKASGRTVESVPVRELRHKQEAAVVKQRSSASGEKKAAPASSEDEPRGKKNTVAPEAAPAEKSVAPSESKREMPAEKKQPAPIAPATRPEPRPEARPESGSPPAKSQPAQPKTNKKGGKPGKQDKV
jgi:hypothetical protein